MVVFYHRAKIIYKFDISESYEELSFQISNMTGKHCEVDFFVCQGYIAKITQSALITSCAEYLKFNLYLKFNARKVFHRLKFLR